jgi:N4-gp56 family major capsid protein
MPTTTYGDISPRTAAYAAVDLLKRGLPYLVIEKTGQMKTLPGKSSKAITFRRYNALALATTALTEGVTPTSKKLTSTDVTATLQQYGDLVEITDVIEDTHEDPIMKEATAILGEQAAQTIETLRFNTLKAGTNVFYTNGTARTDVNTTIAIGDLRLISRALKAQNARFISMIVRSTPSFNTENVPPCFIAIGHTDLEADIRALTGFIDVKDYGSISPWEMEIGSVEGFRFLLSPIFTSWADGGGAAGAMLTTSGTSADVYPLLIFARDAWAGIAFKGKNSVTPMVVNPNMPSKSDPLGQRGSMSWKTYNASVILQDAWMARLEMAATAAP